MLLIFNTLCEAGLALCLFDLGFGVLEFLLGTQQLVVRPGFELGPLPLEVFVVLVKQSAEPGIQLPGDGFT